MRNEAASVWGVPPSLAEAILVIAFAGAVALGATRLDLALYDFLTREGSVLEWSQFGLYSLAAVGAAVVERTCSVPAVAVPRSPTRSLPWAWCS